jgi:hypothetical protein
MERMLVCDAGGLWLLHVVSSHLLIIADILTSISRLYQYTTAATAIAATVAMCPAITRVLRTPALSHGSSSSGS